MMLKKKSTDVGYFNKDAILRHFIGCQDLLLPVNMNIASCGHMHCYSVTFNIHSVYTFAEL